MSRYKSIMVLLFVATLLAAQVRDGKPVSILASVTDSRGRFIDDLRQQDFELREDGKDQTITEFKSFRNTASSVGVLVDVSASMKPRFNNAISAIEGFVANLYRDDELFLMPFADVPRVAADYSNGRSEFGRELWRLTTSGNPALYDSVIEAVRKLKLGRESRKVLLIVSHGGDLVSRASPAAAIRDIRESGVLVYCLGIPASIGSPFAGASNYSAAQIGVPQRGPSPQNPFPLPDPRSIPIPVPGGGPRTVPVPLPVPSDRVEDTVDMDALRALAEAGGGRAWRVRERSGLGEPIDRILSQIRSELRSQYAIGFTPDHPLKDNQWHDVIIRVKESGYTVTSRREYIGK